MKITSLIHVRTYIVVSNTHNSLTYTIHTPWTHAHSYTHKQKHIHKMDLLNFNSNVANQMYSIDIDTGIAKLPKLHMKCSIYKVY